MKITTVVSAGEVTEENGWYSVPLILADNTSGIVISKSEKKLNFKQHDAVVYDSQKKHFKGSMQYVGLKKKTKKIKTTPSGIKAVYRTSLESLLFIDIETVPALPELPKEGPTYNAWEYQRRKFEETTFEELAESYKKKAALFAEFSKIVCISTGYISNGVLKIKSFYDEDERALLTDFSEMMSKVGGYDLCGHYIKGFDIPIIYRRMLSYGIPIPEQLDVAGEKPWNITCVDTADLWKGPGIYSASLTAICLSLGIASSKSQDIDGSKVAELYYSGEDGALEDIVKYCERDVINVVEIMQVFKYDDTDLTIEKV